MHRGESLGYRAGWGLDLEIKFISSPRVSLALEARREPILRITQVSAMGDSGHWVQRTIPFLPG